jgi:tRNA modification GTPase
MIHRDTTICALATHPGMAAIAVVRVSGPEAFSIVDKIFKPYGGKKLLSAEAYSILFGKMERSGVKLDEVLVSVFRGPHSYTGEDTLEISCHGSTFIQQEILQWLYTAGAIPAQPGEFTLRAFLNGKIDLSQAEAVADLIASQNPAAHALAIKQLRGGFGDEIRRLRTELLNFLALVELELDFSTEDVEFANREQLQQLVNTLLVVINRLRDSYAMGNVLKQGVPVSIVGKPNAGKSTLLNALLKEDRAIVSPIAGTTRDTVEDVLVLGGVAFRFIDTAGLRETDDLVEQIGIERSYKSIRQASLILLLVDAADLSSGEALEQYRRVAEQALPEAQIQVLCNKIDQQTFQGQVPEEMGNILMLSAKEGVGLEQLEEALLDYVSNAREHGDHLVSNARHYSALSKASEALQQVLNGLALGLPGDLLSRDLRDTLDALSEITGEVTHDEVLGTIFGKFCIGK